LSRSAVIAGYWIPHFFGELGEALRGRSLGGRGVDRADVPGDVIPAFAGWVAKDVAQQVNHTRMDDHPRPHRVDRLRQDLEADADHDAHIGGAAVF
jgi:hypothetical protein